MRSVDRAPLDVEKVSMCLCGGGGGVNGRDLGSWVRRVSPERISSALYTLAGDLRAVCNMPQQTRVQRPTQRQKLKGLFSRTRGNTVRNIQCLTVTRSTAAAAAVAVVQLMAGMPLKPEDVTYSAYETLVRDRGV
jgi:hypothetical protein